MVQKYLQTWYVCILYIITSEDSAALLVNNQVGM